ncbi:hypothetical protein [Euzebya sp.]|uniref:hypothetical protein n=1 Tax=Euzebya sp. TaxID=1971409 RepID=UPI003513E268
MTATTTPTARPGGRVARRPWRGATRLGHVIALAVDLGLIVLIHVEPGWESVSAITPDAARVIGLVTASLVVGAAANAAFVVSDASAVRAVGDLAVDAVAFAATLQILQVFPFDFGEWSQDWSTPLRVLLVIGLVGAAMGAAEAVIRLLAAPARDRTGR